MTSNSSGTITPQGALVLMIRGGCTFEAKAAAAQAAAAAGLLIFNDSISASGYFHIGPLPSDLAAPIDIPVASVPWSIGDLLFKAAALAEDTARALRADTDAAEEAAEDAAEVEGDAGAPIVVQAVGSMADSGRKRPCPGPPASVAASVLPTLATASALAGRPGLLESSVGRAALMEGVPRVRVAGEQDRAVAERPEENVSDFSSYGPTLDGACPRANPPS